MKLYLIALYAAYVVEAGKKVRSRHKWQWQKSNHNVIGEMEQVSPFIPMIRSTGPPVVPIIPEGYVEPLQSRSNFVSTNGVTCGVAPGDRIVGGFNVNNRAFPWQVMVRPGNDTHHQAFLCGGSIITNRHVLSAAHCFDDGITAAGSYVFAGLDFVGQTIDISQFFTVDSFKNHESYTGVFSASGFDFDISIVTVNKDFPFSAASYPICLPPNDQCLADDTEAQASGFGRVAQSDPLRQAQLKGLNSEIDGYDDCQLRLFPRTGINITPNNICMYGRFMGTTCQGDSGGPMSWKDDTDTAYVIGIVSYSINGCGNKGQPLVFERVSRHLQWIKDNSNIILDSYNDLSTKECVESHVSNFGTGLAGNGVETARRPSKVNDVKHHIKFESNPTKCFMAFEFVLFQTGQRIRYRDCTPDYRSEWVFRPANRQIASAGDGDTMCWTWIKMTKTTSKIALKACNNKDKKQKFSYDQNAKSLYIIFQRKRQYLSVVNTEEVVMKPAKVVPQGFKARVHGDSEDLEYQIKYTVGKVNNKCIRRFKSSLKFGTCGANPYVNPHGFKILENKEGETVVSISFQNRQSGLCLHRAMKKKKKFLALKPCSVTNDLQMFKDIRGSEDDFKLCHPSNGICVGYENKKGKTKWGVFIGPEAIIDGTE